MKKRVLLLSCVIASALSAGAQVSLTGNNPTYSQDFNTLAATGTAATATPTGWSFVETGSNANTEYRAGDGSINTGDTYSYGTGTNTDRAFGTLLSTNLAPVIGSSFLNNTGNAITAVSLSYVGEHWRRGHATANEKDTLAFAYSTNATSLNDAAATWTSVPALHVTSVNVLATTSALNGNTVNANYSSTLTVNVPSGQKIWFRWTDVNIPGTEDGLAIDDFQASFTTTTGGIPDTLVRFTPTSATKPENGGSQNLVLTYVPVSPTSAFTAQVVLKSGNAANIGNYTTQTASFAANTGTVTIPVTITDNSLVDGNKTFVFAIRNPSGAMLVGSDSLFTLTVTDDDAPVPTLPVYTIARVRGLNTGGQPDSLGTECELRGTVYGVNLRTGGLEFTIHDGTAGIGVFAPATASNFGYTVNEGDSIHVRGEIVVYSGLGQIAFLDTLIVAGQGTLKTPTFVTTLSENTESDLIRIANVHLVNPSQWTGAANGFNVDITNGSQTFKMRVHPNTTLFGTSAPVGNFDVMGIGGQFLGTTAVAPFVGQYQIIPRRKEDILLGGSISENETSSKLSIFPNPTQGRFFVNFESASTDVANISLKDLTGRTISVKNVNMVSGNNQIEINENLSAGIYLVSIEMGSVKAVKRVIVK